MKHSTPISGFVPKDHSKPRSAAMIVFVALALVYAANGILNALQAAASPSTGVLRETVLVLLPSIAVVIALWITNISNLSLKARRCSLVATLVVTGLIATISTFGP
jgi:hypothetical protein